MRETQGSIWLHLGCESAIEMNIRLRKDLLELRQQRCMTGDMAAFECNISIEMNIKPRFDLV